MQTETERPRSPGLKWRNRRTGPPVPYWFADPKAVEAGYPVKSANLSAYADRPAVLVSRAERLQSEMKLWLAGQRGSSMAMFDGKFKSLLELYERDPESSFHQLKPGVQETYMVYVRRLTGHIGDLRIDHQDGRDVRRWFAEWRAGEEGKDHLPRAKMVLAVLKAAISFGVVCRFAGCKAFQEVVGELEFPGVKRRKFAPTAEQIIAVRKAAHAAGAHRRALLYALVFETTGRAFDFLGQWVPLDYRKPSATIAYNKKWIGPHWSAIDDKGILLLKPTKTEDTSEVEVPLDLLACQMVVEELSLIPLEERVGPLIPNEVTGLPYIYATFRLGWRADFEAAKIPAEIWCRDLRAGGATEARKSAADKNDLQDVMGHVKPEQTDGYVRTAAKVEAFRRVAKSRTTFRAGNGS